MKQILFFLTLGLSSNFVFAQDIIIKQNGDEIKSKVIEITTTAIKYKEFEFMEGPLRNINITDVFMIIYQNGKREKFNAEKNALEKKEKPLEKENKTNSRKGYIGLSIGPSIPILDYAKSGQANTGLQINIIDFGYMLSKNIGIIGTWYGGANSTTDFDNLFSFGGILIGGFTSFPISDKTEFNFRPMLGFSNVTCPETTKIEYWFGNSYVTTVPPDQAISFAFNLGTSLRYNVTKKSSLLLNLDWFSTRPKFKEASFEQQIETISITIGAAYRLK